MQTMELLLERGAEVDQEDNDGNCALRILQETQSISFLSCW